MQSEVFFCGVQNLLETYFIKIYGGKLSFENFHRFLLFYKIRERERVRKKSETTLSVEQTKKRKISKQRWRKIHPCFDNVRVVMQGNQHLNQPVNHAFQRVPTAKRKHSQRIVELHLMSQSIS